jgi:hypothetical protein
MQTDEVMFNPLRRQRQEALATVSRWAEACDVRVDAVQERPKRLTIDMRVQVTGRPENIISFCQETGGRRPQDPPRNVRRWIGDIVKGILTYGP